MSALNADNKCPSRISVESPKNQPKAYCRCWQSNNFPFCDGSHHEYNKQHQDNLGPLVIQPTNQESA